jgi:dephospho-CoA kinase
MLLIGLTGNIASGKSAVAKILADRGATLIDADVLAREAVEPGTPGLDAIVRRWGKAVVASDGTLDRAALRRIVFAKPAERDALNAIVHPRVETLRNALLSAARDRGDHIVVCDIPLLYEKDMSARFDRVVLVDAPRALRLQRLVKERKLSRADAETMIAAQMSADAKRARADVIIDNAGTRAQLEKRVADVWRALARDADRQPTN